MGPARTGEGFLPERVFNVAGKRVGEVRGTGYTTSGGDGKVTRKPDENAGDGTGYGEAKDIHLFGCVGIGSVTVHVPHTTGKHLGDDHKKVRVGAEVHKAGKELGLDA